MKKLIFVVIFLLFSINIFSQSRIYRPVSDWENQFWQVFDRNVWPDDVRGNFESYRNTLVGWVGIIENFMVDTSHEEYNVIGYYLRHHYFNWIEDFGYSTPINLSPLGEGYFICYYLLIKDHDVNEFIDDIIGDLIINYGYPIEIDEYDGTITLTTEYMRGIGRQFVNPNWLPYGRGGLFGE